MDILTKILFELGQFGFIFSIIFVVISLMDFIIKMIGRFKLNKDTKIVLTIKEKALLLISIAYIFTYLI